MEASRLKKKKKPKTGIVPNSGGERHMPAEGSSGSAPHPEPSGTKDAAGTTGRA